MKSKLLKKLRRIGRSKINIHSITTIGETTVGMSIGFDEDEYRGLFKFGDTKETVIKKAENIYMSNYIKLHKIK